MNISSEFGIRFRRSTPLESRIVLIEIVIAGSARQKSALSLNKKSDRFHDHSFLKLKSFKLIPRRIASSLVHHSRQRAIDKCPCSDSWHLPDVAKRLFHPLPV